MWYYLKDMFKQEIFRTFYVLLILFLPLTAGYGLRKKNLILKPELISIRLIVFLTKAVTPFVVLFSFWKLELTSAKIFTLPLAGMAISTLALAPAFFFVKVHGLNRKQAGSYLTSAMFSNIGYTLGGFIAFVLYGEAGFGLTVLYCLYFKPFYYTIGFYIAENYSSKKGVKIKDNLKKVFTDGIRLFPLLGLAGGIGLNLLGVPRPGFIQQLNGFLIPATTFIYMFAIGMTLKLRAVKRFKVPVLSMSVIKFIWSPLIGLAIAYFLGYRFIMGGLLFKVALIESFMPSAITSLMLPALFNLDQDLSNSCWIFTTLLLIPLLPVMFWILSLL